MLLLIDNYDSFTYNLFDYFQQLNLPVKLIKNNEWDINQIKKFSPSAIILSPGPGTPDDAGITLNVIREFKDYIPLFGVCLGHQAIAQAFGAKVIKGNQPYHGKTSYITHDQTTLFDGIPSPFRVARYHSLQVDPHQLPDCLQISAQTDDGVIMALRHKTLAIEGVQFHPEAILTEHGLQLLSNFIKTHVK